jgi:hypothetical protein
MSRIERVESRDFGMSYKTGSLPHTLTKLDISRHLGFAPEWLPDGEDEGVVKTQWSWWFTVDGEPCAIWDWWGCWSTFDPKHKLDAIFFPNG